MTAPRLPPEVRYRYHFTDIRSGALKATLPLRGASFDDVLGGAADGGGEVPLTDPSARGYDVYAVTATRRTALWAVREELDPLTGLVVRATVPWSGVVMRRQRSLVGRSLSLTAVTWPSYLARRHTPTLSFTGEDVFTVARTLVGESIEQPGSTFPLVSPHHAPLRNYGGVDSGITTTRAYRASDRKPVLENLDELASADPGFDWKFTPIFREENDLRTLAVRLDLGYPRLGREEPPDVRWRAPRSPAERGRAGIILGGTLAEDGSAADNELTGLGSGSGPTQLRSTRTADEAGIPELAAGVPLYQSVLRGATPDLRTQGRLDSYVLGQVRGALISEVKISGVTVRGDLPPTVADYEIGDDATLEVEDLAGRRRSIVAQIVSRKLQPPESGRTEQVSFDLQGTATVTS